MNCSAMFSRAGSPSYAWTLAARTKAALGFGHYYAGSRQWRAGSARHPRPQYEGLGVPSTSASQHLLDRMTSMASTPPNPSTSHSLAAFAMLANGVLPYCGLHNSSEAGSGQHYMCSTRGNETYPTSNHDAEVLSKPPIQQVCRSHLLQL